MPAPHPSMRFLVCAILLIIAATTSTDDSRVVVFGIDATATRDGEGSASCPATDADGTCIDGASYPSAVDDDDREGSAGGGGVEEIDEVDEDDEEDEEDDEDEDGKTNPIVLHHDEGDDDDRTKNDDDACPDKSEGCTLYAKSGGCVTNPGYMTYNCASTCGTCDVVDDAERGAEFADKDGGNTGPCMDDEYECKEWAGTGECEVNPE